MFDRGKVTGWERDWGMFCHLAGFAFFVFPLGGILGPLIIWLSKKDESEWVDTNGKASINFQLSLHLYLVLCIPLVFIVVGGFLIVALAIFNLVFLSIASVKAGKGELFRYPLSIPFIQ